MKLKITLISLLSLTRYNSQWLFHFVFSKKIINSEEIVFSVWIPRNCITLRSSHWNASYNHYFWGDFPSLWVTLVTNMRQEADCRLGGWHVGVRPSHRRWLEKARLHWGIRGVSRALKFLQATQMWARWWQPTATKSCEIKSSFLISQANLLLKL